MADNMDVTPGTGKTIAADDIAGVLHQRVKISVGADGVAADWAGTVDVNASGGIGSLTETAPATDTASSGLNGRLQRIAQRLTSLIALVPASLGAKTAAASLAVTMATDDVLVAPIGGLTETAPATDTASSGLNGRLQRIAQRLTTMLTGIVLAAGENHIGQVSSHQVTCSTDVTLAGTTIYSANDAMADSGPTAGGFTFTGAGRASGGSGVITDLVVVSSVAPTALPLSGEVWIFDSTVTALADNAVFNPADADMKLLVGIVPFLLYNDANMPNSVAHVQGLDIGFTCAGTANLRFLLKVKNAYTPNTDVLTFRLKALQVT